MNEVIETIKKRRSVRAFLPTMPPADIVRDIVEAGLYAPRSMGSESVRTIVITDKVMREKLVELNCQIGHWKKGLDPF